MSEGELKNKTVLFADDEPQFIEALIAVAEAEGARVFQCRDASKAIEIVLSQNIDCLVIDVMMHPGSALPGVGPQKAGIEAIKVIQKTKPRQSIICFSVVSDQVEISRLKQSGVLFLRKAETSLDKTMRLIISKATGLYKAR